VINHNSTSIHFKTIVKSGVNNLSRLKTTLKFLYN